MRVWISDTENELVTILELIPGPQEEPEIFYVEGELPDGLTLQDLFALGVVDYRSGKRGKPVPTISTVEPSENLEFIRALTEALPPGYHVSKVESEVIDKLREEKAEKFFEEIETLRG